MHVQSAKETQLQKWRKLYIFSSLLRVAKTKSFLLDTVSTVVLLLASPNFVSKQSWTSTLGKMYIKKVLDVSH